MNDCDLFTPAPNCLNGGVGDDLTGSACQRPRQSNNYWLTSITEGKYAIERYDYDTGIVPNAGSDWRTVQGEGVSTASSHFAALVGICLPAVHCIALHFQALPCVPLQPMSELCTATHWLLLTVTQWCGQQYRKLHTGSFEADTLNLTNKGLPCCRPEGC